MHPPALGVGIIHAPGLEAVLAAGAGLIDVIEIEPQLRRAPGGGYELREEVFGPAERLERPKLVHGVGFPVGGTQRPNERDLAPYVEAVERTGAPWASEHLSFNQIGRGASAYFGGFLLPPIQSPQAVRLAAANIRAVRRLLPVPFAFETGVNYLGRRPGELSDGEFFGAVAEEADCGILLDLHNLWCNERNGRQGVLDALEQMPLERVWEVHLAGGSELDGLWLDAHSAVPPEPLYELAEQILPALPNLGAVIFEIAPEALGRRLVSVDAVVDQLRRLRTLWEQSRAAAPQALRHRPSVTLAPAAVPAPQPPDPARWESVLGALTVQAPVPQSDPALCAGTDDTGGSDGDGDGGGLRRALSADPALPTLRTIVESFRSGVIVNALPLTFRMIMFSRGESGFHALMRDFWAGHPPCRFPPEELDAFLDFLSAGDTGGTGGAPIPHLAEVATYEMTVRQVRATGAQERVKFTRDPVSLLADLRAFRAPAANAEPAEYELLIKP